jgi:hypothetical protein
MLPNTVVNQPALAGLVTEMGRLLDRSSQRALLAAREQAASETPSTESPPSTPEP